MPVLVWPLCFQAIAEADVILAVNARFGEATTKWSLLGVPNPKRRIIHTHASDRELGKIYRPEIAYMPDLIRFLPLC